MNQNDDEVYDAWLKQRRFVDSNERLTDRILSAVADAASVQPCPPATHLQTTRREQIGPWLLWTAASLVFAARIASVVGNLIFPTESFPEFAVDHRIEEPADEHRNASRS